jgi:2Fe-2S ferredoxin
MTTVTYILEDNSEFVIEAETGQNLMQLALDNGLEGIEGACGGSCMCATCHVLIEEMLGVEASRNGRRDS